MISRKVNFPYDPLVMHQTVQEPNLLVGPSKVDDGSEVTNPLHHIIILPLGL